MHYEEICLSVQFNMSQTDCRRAGGKDDTYTRRVCKQSWKPSCRRVRTKPGFTGHGRETRRISQNKEKALSTLKTRSHSFRSFVLRENTGKEGAFFHSAGDGETEHLGKQLETFPRKCPPIVFLLPSQ